MVQMPYQNPHAENMLFLPVLVLCNTPDEELHRNIIANSAKPLPWINLLPPNNDVAVLCGGGPSLADSIDEIRDWQAKGAIIFAMNAASTFLRERGVTPDYQVIADAKPETADLYDPDAKEEVDAGEALSSTTTDPNAPVLEIAGG
jgi:hypothetical protein